LIDISIENCENHTLLKKLDFCELNCLEIAFAGSNYYYMSHAFIQNILDNEWLGKVANQYGHLSNIKVKFYFLENKLYMCSLKER
jgi:hypothetical protein